MLYVVSPTVITGIFGGLFVFTLFAGAMALSAKTGFIYATNASNVKKVHLYNDRS